MTTMQNLTLTELNERFDEALGSPTDPGRVEMIVVRPEHDIRETPNTVRVGAFGLEGDHWSTGEYRDEPDTQIAIISSRVIDLVARSRERWALAGDNLVADMDLSPENLPTGQRLEVGSAILEITAIPHRGCAKFAARFGADALRFVNVGRGGELRFRGVYARVVQPGVITTGDEIRKI
ncbi:MAG: MOSC domain-containing protein [Acidimicrobiia bacterium]